MLVSCLCIYARRLIYVTVYTMSHDIIYTLLDPFASSYALSHLPGYLLLKSIKLSHRSSHLLLPGCPPVENRTIGRSTDDILM